MQFICNQTYDYNIVDRKQFKECLISYRMMCACVCALNGVHVKKKQLDYKNDIKRYQEKMFFFHVNDIQVQWPNEKLVARIC